MKKAVLIFGCVAALLSGQSKGKQRSRTFTGVVTDSMCATGDHSHMKMGSDDRECTIACVEAHGADYVLSDGHLVYVLSDAKQGLEFAGQKVIVTGSLKGTMLEVQAIRAVK